MAQPCSIAKSGWMYRLSSVLRRWKRNWFVLYENGDLKYFDSQDSHHAEETIIVRAECTQVLQGKMIDKSINPPEGRKREQLLQLKLRTCELTMCAESDDEMRAWQILLDDARVLRGPPPTHVAMGPPPPYPGQPATAPPQQVVYPPPAYPSYHSPSVYTTTSYPRQTTAYAYPGQVFYGSNPTTYIQPAPTTTVIYANNPRHRRNFNGDMATGFVAGAAVGTMMWSPMLFW